MRKSLTQKTLSLLLAGKLAASKKFAGQHVMVVKNEILPLRGKKEEIWKKIRLLEEKYGETPIIAFVTRQDISYILWRVS